MGKYRACINCMGYCLLTLNMYMCAQDTLTSFTDITDTPIIGLQCYYQDIFILNNGSWGCGLPNIDYYSVSGLAFPFNLYCVNCSVTLDTEWTYHIGVDLDLQLSQEGGGSTVYVSDLLYCV